MQHVSEIHSSSVQQAFVHFYCYIVLHYVSIPHPILLKKSLQISEQFTIFDNERFCTYLLIEIYREILGIDMYIPRSEYVQIQQIMQSKFTHGHTSWQPNQLCMTVPVCLYPCHHLALSVFLTLALLVSVQWLEDLFIFIGHLDCLFCKVPVQVLGYFLLNSLSLFFFFFQLVIGLDKKYSFHLLPITLISFFFLQIGQNFFLFKVFQLCLQFSSLSSNIFFLYKLSLIISSPSPHTPLPIIPSCLFLFHLLTSEIILFSLLVCLYILSTSPFTGMLTHFCCLFLVFFFFHCYFSSS